MVPDPKLQSQLILNNSIFAREISGILFVLGQHLVAHTRTRGDPPKVLGLVSKELQYPWLSLLLLTASLADPGV